MFKRTIGLGVPMLSAMATYNAQSMTVSNEPKRKFYENEAEVVPILGTVIPAAGSEIEALGPNRLIDGISVRSPAEVEGFFKGARESLQSAFKLSHHYVNQWYSKVYATERQITSTVSELHHKHESLLPNSIYILIAGLSGSILARRRGIFSRALFPVVLGAASFKYFLPQTFSNTTDFIWRLEKQNLPEIADQQELAVHKASALVESIEQKSISSGKYLEDRVQGLRRSIADVTGLNIDEEVSKK